MPYVTEERYTLWGELVEKCGFKMRMLELALQRRDAELVTLKTELLVKEGGNKYEGERHNKDVESWFKRRMVGK